MDPLNALPIDQRAWVEVNRTAIRANAAALRDQLAPNTSLMAVVKADGYGHGASTAANASLAGGASSLGVATVEEGLALRSAGIEAPILVLGYTSGPEVTHLLGRHDLTLTVCSIEQALEFDRRVREFPSSSEGSMPTPLPVHLKLDTGMTRLGTCWEETKSFVDAVRELKTIRIAGVYSHLAQADSQDPEHMLLQKRRFDESLAVLAAGDWRAPTVHLANSAATLRYSAFHYDMVRVGLALYGVWPAAHVPKSVDLRQALSVRARLTQVKSIPAGTGISYGSTFVSDKPMRIAAVSIGYADGVPWPLAQKISPILRGRRVHQLGRITMDQLTIDVTDTPDARPGEIVTLLGRDGDEEVTVDDWAGALGTISWEVLCSFKVRLPRVEVDD